MRKTLDHTVHTTSGQRRRIDERHPLGHRQQLPGRHPHLLGVPATGEQGAHLVADGPAVDALTERLDDPAHLEPRDVGLAGRWRVVALALQQVGAVDSGSRDPHEHLAGARGGRVDVGEHQRVGAAELGEGDRLHPATVCPGRPVRAGRA